MFVLFLYCASAQFVKNPNFDITTINKIAIFPFSGNNELGAGLADMIALNLMERNVVVVERSEVQRVFAEQGLSQTGLVQESQIIETGKMLGVDAIMLGSVIYKKVEFYYQGQYIMKDGIGNANIRMVDTKTGALIGGIKFKNGQGVLTFKSMDAIAKQISDEILKTLGKNINASENIYASKKNNISKNVTKLTLPANNSTPKSLTNIDIYSFFDIARIRGNYILIICDNFSYNIGSRHTVVRAINNKFTKIGYAIVEKIQGNKIVMQIILNDKSIILQMSDKIMAI